MLIAGHVSSQQPKSTSLSTVSFLGAGGYGRVTLVRDGTSHRLYALKTVQKAHILEQNGARRCEWIRREREVLAAIEHPFVVSLHGSYADESSVSLLLGVALGGDLYRLLDDLGTLPEATARFYAASAVLALGHLHRCGVVYRDLKLENVLLDAQGFVKLCDFGFAKAIILQDGRPLSEHALGEGGGRAGGRTFTKCGTDDYMAPELLRGHGVGLACDWWTLGVITYEILHGFPPFTAESDRITHENILRGVIRYAPDAPSSAGSRAFIAALCTSTEADRLGFVNGVLGEDGAERVQAHAWFGRAFDWTSLVNLAIEPPWRPPLASAVDTSCFDADLSRRSASAHDGKQDVSGELLERWRALQRFYAGGEALHAMGHLR